MMADHDHRRRRAEYIRTAAAVAAWLTNCVIALRVFGVV